jgi:hypothetical protein
MSRQLLDPTGERGGYMPRSVGSDGSFLEALIAMVGSMDPLPLGRGCESRIDHYLVDRVTRLRDDKLQVQVGQARDHNGLRSSAVRIHRVGARARAPARRVEVPVHGNRVNLCEIPFAIKSYFVDAINDYGRPVRDEECSVDRKGIAAADGGIAAIASVGRQGRRNDQSKR